MATAFDIHEHRHQLKQRRDSGDTQLFDARDRIACPVCGEPFERLFRAERSAVQFPENDGARFCLVHNEEAILLFRH